MGFFDFLLDFFDSLQTVKCSSCGREMKIFNFKPTGGFYVISKRTKKVYYQSMLLSLISPDNTSLAQLKRDEGVETVGELFKLDDDGSFKYFYILCPDCYEYFSIDDFYDLEFEDLFDEEPEENYSSLVNCKKCNARISIRARKCPKCGYKTERYIECSDCGAKVSSDLDTCPECGAPLDFIEF